MKRIAIILIIIVNFSCSDLYNDRFYKEKFDEEISITNKTDTIISEIKVWGGSNPILKDEKVWIFKDVAPEETKTIVLNIKREVKLSEGSIYVTAILNKNDTIKGGIYFTNWQILGENPTKFNINRD